jgi:hypothetical protein
MGDFDNELKGMLFKNDRKESDEDRDYAAARPLTAASTGFPAGRKTRKAERHSSV